MLHIFHMYLSYLKTLTKIEIYSERILSFRTLNEHIFVKFPKLKTYLKNISKLKKKTNRRHKNNDDSD